MSSQNHTLASVGAELGLTRERIRQIEVLALRKLKVAYQIDELVGPERAAQILVRLRGRPLRRYEAALFCLQNERKSP